MGHRREQSIERVIATALMASAIGVAVVVAATAIAIRIRSTASQANALADNAAAALNDGAAPQPLLAMLLRNGSIRSAMVYRGDGGVVATAGSAVAHGEVICRSLAGGGTLCIEPPLQRRAPDAYRTAVTALAAALVIGGTIAFVTSRRIARRLTATRVVLESAIDDRTSSTRLPESRGALGTLVQAANRLLEVVQQRDLALRRHAAELEEANKDLEAFTSAVSHDLRGPLGSVAGFAQALEEDHRQELDAEAAEYLHWIRDGCEQMVTLIEGLLQVSRVSRAEMKREEVNLSEMARKIAESLRRAQPERQVDFAIANGVVANGDELMLRAVMENLIGNAWKFTSKQEQARIEIGVSDDNGHAAYFVRDNGAGFDPAHASKMFRPFQRLHSEKEFHGTGVGLATVQKIVQRHGGRVWAEGEPDRGATIYFMV